MSLESIIRSTDDASEEREFTSLRPKDFSEYIGQKRIIRNLKIAVQAARERGEPLDHLLFHGPPGLGKTTLAHVIAAEMDAEIVCTSGPALKGRLTWWGYSPTFPAGMFFSLTRYTASKDSGGVHLSRHGGFSDRHGDRPGAHARTVKLELNHFTIVGPPPGRAHHRPLRDRFGFSMHLEFYDSNDLCTIIRRSAGILEPPSPKGGPNQWPCDPGARPE